MSINTLDVQKIVNAIRGALPHAEKNIVLHEPVFAGNEWEYVKECIDTVWVSSVGKYVDKFEEMLAAYTGTKKAVATVNGTAALHICLKLAGVGKDHEVLMPALTFVATANAVAYCQAIPHFVDSEKRTLGIDPFKLNDYLKDITVIRDGNCYNKFTDRIIKAIVSVHTFGHPVDLDELQEICLRYKITMIEDAAESLGSFYKGKHTGNWGKLSALSFNGNKIITTGGGGAIITNDEKLAKQAKHITTTAKVPHQWDFYHDQTGYNYRLPNINAALGCAQLEQLPDFLANKRKLAAIYKQEFADVRGITFFNEPEFAKSNYWLNVLLLDEDKTEYRDQILQTTNEEGIMTRPVWKLMNKLPMYQECPMMDLSGAESLEKSIINIPSSQNL